MNHLNNYFLGVKKEKLMKEKKLGYVPAFLKPICENILKFNFEVWCDVT